MTAELAADLCYTARVAAVALACAWALRAARWPRLRVRANAVELARVAGQVAIAAAAMAGLVAMVWVTVTNL